MHSFSRAVVLAGMLPLVTIALPAQAALDASARGSLTVHLVENDDPAIVAGTRVRIDTVPGGTGRGTITLTWKAPDRPAGSHPGELHLVRWSGTQWLRIAPGTATDSSAVISASQPGTYAMRWYPAASDCTAPPYHELDYRLGKWHYVAKGYDPGESDVTTLAGHCALDDRYVDVTGGKSRSLYIYEPATDHWWVTTIDPGGRSIMQGTAWKDSTAFYHSPTDREIYRKQADGRVEFAGERSSDGGSTWAPWVTARYTRVPDSAQH